MCKRDYLNDFTLFDPKKDSESKITKEPGIYAILLRPGSSMPKSKNEISYTPCIIKYQGEEYELIYVGISDTGLYERDYKKHFNGTAGSSTLRKSLGSLMGLKKTYRSKKEAQKVSGSIKTKFVDTDEEKLSEWMNNNLLLLFKATSNRDKIETEMIAELNPPLNIQKNNNSVNADYRKMLSSLRNDLSDLKM